MNFRDPFEREAEPGAEDRRPRPAERADSVAPDGLHGYQGEPYGVADALGALWRWKGLLVVVGTLVLLPLLWLSFGLEPRYSTSVKVLVDPRETNATDGPPLVGMPRGDPAAILSEMEIIDSSATLGRVVDRLDLDEREGYGLEREAEGVSLLAGLRGALGSGQDDGDGAAGDAEDEARARAIEALAENLRLLNAEDSRVIEIRVTADAARTAAEIADAIAAEFVHQQEAFQEELESSTSRWIDERATALRANLERVEAEALRFRLETLRLVGSEREAVQAQLDALVDVLAGVLADVTSFDSERAAAEAAVAERGPRALLAFVDSPILAQFAERAADLELEIRQLAGEHGETHPRLERPRRQLAATLAEMDAAASLQLAGLSDRLERARLQRTAVETEIDALRDKLEALDRRLIIQRSLDREVENETGVLNSFVVRLRQTEGAYSEAALPRIISPATVPLRPAQPRRAVLGVVAILFSGIVAAGVVLAADRRRRARVWTASDVRHSLGVPVVGFLPSTRRLARARRLEAISVMIADRRSQSRLGPMADSLASALILLARSRDDGPITIAATAAEPGLGQTTVLSIAAAGIAQYGQRVLVVDFGLGRHGLAARLGGDARSFDMPSPTDIEGVSLLSVDPKGAATTLVLERNGFSGTFRDYDVVLIDCPVIELLSEPALSLAREERTVLIAAAGRSTFDSLRDAVAQLDSEGCTVSGVILNRARGTQFKGRP